MSDQKPLMCCQAAHIDCSEQTAMIIFVLNLITLGSLGSLFGSCIDKNGAPSSFALSQSSTSSHRTQSGRTARENNEEDTNHKFATCEEKF